MANEELLREWYAIKKQIKALQEREYEIKEEVIPKLNEDGEFEAGKYTVKLRKIKRRLFTKKDVPKEVFEEYAKVVESKALYLSKTKNKGKRSRSPSPSYM